MRKLIHAARFRGSRTVLPSVPPNPSADVLLVVGRSASARWQAGKAYFAAAAASGLTKLVSQLENAEGFLFLFEPEPQANGAKYEEMPVSAPASCIKLCQQVVGHVHAEDVLERFRGQVYFQELLYELYRARDRGQRDTAAAVEQTRAYMDEHYAESLSIEDLAAMAGVSASYYMELFRKIVGRSPIEYLTSARIDAAKRLLDETEGPAHQVAQAVGYRDPLYFSRQFKRVTGVSPSRYARRNARRIVSFHYPMTGQMLALQNIPFAAPLDREFCLFYKQRYEMHIPVHLKDPAVETNRAFNLEALHEARPDVVIAGDWLPAADRDELNRIAPTLCVPWWSHDWREHLLIVARFLGEEAQAERWLAKYDAQAAAIRGPLKERLGDSSVLAIHVLQGTIHRFGSRNLGTVLYDDLRLRPAGQSRAAQAYEPLTAEQLLALNPDRLLVAVGDDPLSRQLWTNLGARPEWQELDAVRERRVHRIQPDPWFDYSAMGHERILKEVVKLFSLDRPS